MHKEIHHLRQQLALLEEDKRELEQRCQSSEERARDLRHSGKAVHRHWRPLGARHTRGESHREQQCIGVGVVICVSSH